MASADPPPPISPAPPHPSLSFDAFPEIYALEIPNHLPALVLVPIRARRPMPLIVMAHGAGGSPELQCERWRPVVQQRAFVLCIRGYTLGLKDAPHPRFFYPTHNALGRELESALSELARVFDGLIDMKQPVFIGFSQGAVMGAMILPNHPAKFTRAVLTEGGSGEFSEWNIPVARRFAERGGKRVLLVCGRPSCNAFAEDTGRWLKKAGLVTSVLLVKGAGHDERAILNKGLANAFEWLVEDDPRFQPDHLD